MLANITGYIKPCANTQMEILKRKIIDIHGKLKVYLNAYDYMIILQIEYCAN